MSYSTATASTDTNVYEEDGLVKFPAFVHLPASTRPHINGLISDNDTDLVKFVTLCTQIRPVAVHTFRKQIATRCRIDESGILAIIVNHNGRRIFIETEEDWEEWTAALFSPLKNHTPSAATYFEKAQLRLSPVDIRLVLEQSEEQTMPARAATFTATATSVAASTQADANPARVSVPVESARSFPQQQQQRQQEQLRQQQRQQEEELRRQQRQQEQEQRDQQREQERLQRQQQRQQEDVQRQHQRRQEEEQRQRSSPNLDMGAGASQTGPRLTPSSPQVQPLLQLHSLGSTIASNVAQSVLQALQPLSRELPPAVSSMLSDLSSQMGNLPVRQASGSSTTLGSGGLSRQPSETPSTVQPPAPSSSERSNQSVESQQRQSLMEGMLDELSRVREQRTTDPSSQSQLNLESEPSESGETSMNTELTQAFTEMLAQRNAAEQSTVESREDDEESLTIISTPSDSPRRSRSRSRSRSPSRRALLSGTTLTILTIFTLLLGLVTPSLATPATSLSFTSLNPRDLASSNSRHLHLCKCTCFQTNSTLVPLYAPLDPAKPCGTCTRQFCLDQGLAICKSAKLPETDHDTGTGLEGDVWAKCFERDSGKDQGIITLYLLVVVGLVAWAGLRGRVGGWVREYQTMGPGGLANAVRNAPWRRSSR